MDSTPKTESRTLVQHRRLPSFDGTEVVDGDLTRPDRYRDLFAALNTDQPVIARGAGLSYCNAGAGAGVRSVSTRLFNRILQFDAEGGFITVEPGLTVGDLLEFVVARGWYLPVLPGYPCITVGGCVGFNVHGKTQHNVGCFGDFVEELRLYHPDHGEMDCSRSQNAEILRLTVGGFGLTGFVTQVRLRLNRLEARRVVCRKTPVASLAAAVQEMERQKNDAHVLYSWNDLNQRGAPFGAGIVYSERPAAGGEPGTLRRRRLTPESRSPFPFNLFNPLSIRLMCEGYRRVETATAGEREQGIMDNAFPIAGKEIYYAFFGRKGLRECQVVLPRAAWDAAAVELDGLLGRSGVLCTLGSLKLFSGRTELLNFCGEGICLALDAPAGLKTAVLFDQLDAWVIRHHGIANISKDSRLTAAAVRDMYPEYEAFRSRLRAFDPRRRMDSALRRRLDV